MILVELAPYEELPERPFTDRRYIDQEHQIMRFMAACAWMVLAEVSAIRPAGEPIAAAKPIILHQPAADGWIHRIIITQPERLQHHKPLTVVGFFGLRSETGDVALAQRLDRQLIPELSQHDDLLAYVSTCLPTGNFGNLVLFASPEGKERWGLSEKHALAVRVLTPEYYVAVRLYNGELAQGLSGLESLRLRLVKYYDYRSQPLWRAVRQLPVKDEG